MLRQIVLIFVSMALFAPLVLADTPSPPGAKVYIIEPRGGGTVTNPVKVLFGLRGMGVAPAGTDVEMTGHHHLVVDQDTPPLNDYLPTGDPQIIHFGKGQTETDLVLEPGEHRIQLVLGDKDHKPHVPPVVSEIVVFTVK